MLQIKRYAIEYTQYQIHQFKIFDSELMQQKLMSFYSFLSYHDSIKNGIKMSLDEITKRWNNKHKKKGNKSKIVAKTTIYRWIKKLESVNLINIQENISKTFVYTLISKPSKCNKICNTKKHPESIDTSSVEDNESCDNTITTINNIDIDPKTEQVSVNNFQYNKYINNQEKVTSWQEVYDTLQKAFKIKKMHKNSKRKNRILVKMYQNFKNITKKHLMSYILTVIENTKKESEITYYNNKYDTYTKPSTFNSFPQRQYKDGELDYLAEISSGNLKYRPDEYKIKMKEKYGY